MHIKVFNIHFKNVKILQWGQRSIGHQKNKVDIESYSKEDSVKKEREQNQKLKVAQENNLNTHIQDQIIVESLVSLSIMNFPFKYNFLFWNKKKEEKGRYNLAACPRPIGGISTVALLIFEKVDGNKTRRIIALSCAVHPPFLFHHSHMSACLKVGFQACGFPSVYVPCTHLLKL